MTKWWLISNEDVLSLQELLKGNEKATYILGTGLHRTDVVPDDFISVYKLSEDKLNILKRAHDNEWLNLADLDVIELEDQGYITPVGRRGMEERYVLRSKGTVALRNI